LAEWLYEAGIGEARAALVEDGRIVAAELEVEGALRVGEVARARLIEAARGGGLVRIGDVEAALDRVPAGLSVGRELTVREAIPDPGRSKRARVAATDDPPTQAPTLAGRLGATGRPVRTLRAHEPDALEAAGWSELLGEAETGEIAFAGGALRMAPTPAMTLFDVDGIGDPAVLAAAAARAVGEAIERHRIGGSIGIDFPTLTGKAERQRVGEAIDATLAKPFERTAVNGFGFLQIVRPRPRASLPELIRADPVGAAARAALRMIERVPPGAPNTHRLPAAVVARIEARPDWLAELVRRTGRMPILVP
jgi:ribonuclease G